MSKAKPTTKASKGEDLTRAGLPKLLASAAAGKLDWLHRIVAAAGYRRASAGVTAREIAEFYQVSPQAVGLWATRDGCPRRKDGWYDLGEVIRWRESRSRGGEANEAAGPSLKAQIEASELKMLNLKIAEKEGQMLPRADVERREESMAKAFRAGVEGLARVLAPRLYGRNEAEAEQLIRDEVERVLRELSA